MIIDPNTGKPAEPHKESTRGISRIARLALEIEAEEAQQAGSLAFLARVFVQCGLPHREPRENEFTRQNGLLRLHLMAPRKVGLPSGKLPRLLLCWMTSEAVRTRSSRLELGASLSDFMTELGIVPTGGRWGSITRLKDQMRRLLTTTLTVERDDSAEGIFDDVGFRLAEEQHLAWDPKSADQALLWGSWVQLNQRFFEILIERPVPVDFRALRALRSPLALDAYCFLTHRYSYLRKPTVIPWELLARQFGSNYADLRVFKFKLLKQLTSVLKVYPSARVEETEDGLRLLPSPTHVSKAPTATHKR